MIANLIERGRLDCWYQVARDGQWVTPRYYKGDIEEIQVSVSENDIKSRSGDLQLNLIAKGEVNDFVWGARFFLRDEKFKAQNLTQGLIDEGASVAGQIAAPGMLKLG